MSYSDEPEQQPDRARDRKATGRGQGRRSAQPARPAWDAATYGRPDDTRRRPASPPLPEPVAVYAPPTEPAFPEAPYEPERHYPGGLDPGGRDPRAPDPDFAPPAAPARPPAPSPQALPPAAPALAAPAPAAPPSVPLPVRVNPEPAPVTTSRAGRNLPAAIAVGLGLGAVIVFSLFVWRPAFLGVVALAVGIGTWELTRAIKSSGANPPLIPLLGGGAVMTALAWWGGADALTFGLILTVLTVMVWRLTYGFRDYARDVAAGTLVAVYVPFLAGFAAMLAASEDGAWHVLVMILAVVLSDTGGYATGVRFGKHPMAPSVSPKKSWEGLAGSLLAAAAGCAVFFLVAFDVAAWKGALFGLAVSVAAVIGDLGESMVKRALGVKDMSRLLPGHGGLMDRLDSILFAAPTAYILLNVLLR